MARIDTLERHAAALRDAFTAAAFKSDAAEILELLRTARNSLGVAHSNDQFESVERVVDSASLLLASLGRTT
jgi:hypothetical protein